MTSRALGPNERRTLLVIVDALLLVATLGLSLWRRSGWEGVEFDVGFVTGYVETLVLPIAWMVLLSTGGAYDPARASTPRVVRSILLAGGIIFALYSVAYFVAPRDSLPRSFVLLYLAAAASALGVWRVGFAWMSGRPGFRRRVVIIGSGNAARRAAQAFEEYGPTFEVVAPRMADGYRGLPALVSEAGVSDLVVAVEGMVPAELLDALLLAQEAGATVIPMPVAYEMLTGRVPVHDVGAEWYATLPLSHPQSHRLYSGLKRAIDLAIAIPSIVVFGALLPLLALFTKLDSKGPVFYRQDRVGRNGRVFSILKLRTMVRDAEASGKAVWATRRDPRVTRVGRILRATMLDEMPQLWNVVRGEMSIVGPRPERPELVAELEKEIPYYRLRHVANPGMAGWSLLHKGYSDSREGALEKVEYDLYYIKHQSLWLDVVIILRTIAHALTFRRSERPRSDKALAA